MRPHPTSTLFPYTTLFRSKTETRRQRAEDRKQRASSDNLWPLLSDLCLSPLVSSLFHSIIYTTDSLIMGFLKKLFGGRSEEHTSELQSHVNLVCRLLLEKK